MNQVNPLPRDSKADSSKIATERNVNVSGVNVKNKVAANREVASKADAKSGCFGRTSGGR
jgi:hypothetical protein